MNSIELAELVTDEKRSFQYICDRIDRLSCPRCSCKKFYLMSRHRLRCASCKEDLRPLAGSKFSEIRIPASKWLCLIRQFERSTSARDASGRTGLSYNTALKAFDVIRRSIIEGISAQGGAFGLGQGRSDPFIIRKQDGESLESRTAIFGIIERDGKVSVAAVLDITAEMLMQENVKKAAIGNIIYTDRFRGYDSLIFCGYRYLNIPAKFGHNPDEIHINSKDGFWRFAKERLSSFHGISCHKLFLYLKEVEWRYNNRNDDLYDMLIYYMLQEK